jgi:hypothetical protein
MASAFDPAGCRLRAIADVGHPAVFLVNPQSDGHYRVEMTAKFYFPFLLGATALGGATGFVIGRNQPYSDYGTGEVPHPVIEKAFDGDTVLLNEQVVKIRGLDAPEVATNASCLAEAALGGLAQQYVAGELFNYGDSVWRLENVEQVDGRVIGDLVRSDGENIVDLVTINGYGIASNERWDWCHRVSNFDDNQLYPAINVGSGPPSDVRVADD